MLPSACWHVSNTLTIIRGTAHAVAFSCGKSIAVDVDVDVDRVCEAGRLLRRWLVADVEAPALEVRAVRRARDLPCVM